MTAHCTTRCCASFRAENRDGSSPHRCSKLSQYLATIYFMANASRYLRARSLPGQYLGLPNPSPSPSHYTPRAFLRKDRHSTTRTSTSIEWIPNRYTGVTEMSRIYTTTIRAYTNSRLRIIAILSSRQIEAFKAEILHRACRTAS